MTSRDKDELKSVVKEAVHEQIPETLAEILAPMVKHSTSAVFRRYRRMAVGGFALLAIAFMILYINVVQVADHNTQQNHIQDCILAGMIRGIAINDTDPMRSYIYQYALGHLDKPAKCPRIVIPAPEPPH